MASKREQVLEAVKALLVEALPFASVKRNAAKPSGIQAGGAVFMRDGEPGEPEVDLSPLTYYYTHRIPFEAVPPAGSADREAAVDAMLAAIGTAVKADPTLGGLALFAEPEAPTFADLETTGSAGGISAEAAIVVVYATQNPLN